MLALTRQHSDQENTYTEIVNAPFKYTGSLQTERERFTEHTFQADWLRPLGKGHQLDESWNQGDRFMILGRIKQPVPLIPGIDLLTNDEFRWYLPV